MQIKIFSISILLLLYSISIGQPPLDWVHSSSVGGSFEDYVEDVHVDNNGNTYVCGSFRSSLTFGSDNLFTNGAKQAFVAKFDPSGNPLWGIQSTFTDGRTAAKSIITDDAGNVYVTGYHNQSMLLFSGLSINSSSNEGFFILKVSTSGLPLHLIGPTFATTGKSRAYAVATDGDSVFVAGSHQAAINFPGGPSIGATVGKNDIFIASIDSALSSFGYAFSHGGTEDDVAYAIANEGNNLLLTGSYGNSSCTFNTSGTDYILPSYGNRSIWLSKHDKSNGSVLWATSAGSATGNSIANDLTLNGTSVLITGSHSDVCTFVESPSTSGPFTYNDTAYSQGGTDIFVARYNSSGFIQDLWTEGGVNDDNSYGITNDPNCDEIQICGGFRDSINFGNTTPLIANGEDIFVASYDSTGVFNWAFKENSSGDESATAISSNTNRSSLGGLYTSKTHFHTNPLTEANWNGYNDLFVSSFQCSTVSPCKPTITSCASNDTVSSDNFCSHVLGDYQSDLTVVDGCGNGLNITQTPIVNSILNAGVHTITLEATDLVTGFNDVCLFDVVVEANVSPIVVECGDSFTNETTGGLGNTSSSYSCSSTTTSGEDAVYQLLIPSTNQYVQIKLSNAVDNNDEYAYAYWLGSNCPNTTNCISVDSFNISSNQFSNQSQFLTFSAPGPGTYYLVIDSKTDSIQSYDIEFSCNNSGLEFDKSGCSPQDTDSDGIVAFKNGSNASLSVQPCETATFCHDIYLSNDPDWDWPDSIEFILGDCYENINTTTLTPDNPPVDNGFYDSNGEWSASYNAGSNSIIWEFDHSSGNSWGDGDYSGHNCLSYSFCFEADISATCPGDEELAIGIAVGSDGEKDQIGTTNLFDIKTSDNYTLQDDNPYFSYPSDVLCEGDANTLPDSITTTGGTFTADPGIVFTDGSPSASGEIDLTASSVGGPYTITYTVGLCPFTKDTTVEIQAQQNPTFSYSSNQYCQGDTDPVATITGTGGGFFFGPTEITFISTSTGEIDLSASIVGGPYYIKYTTPGPYCVNTDSFAVTIDQEDDPSFNYSAIDYCKNDPHPSPSSITTVGGTFSESTGTITINGTTGEVDLTSSPTGSYYVTYTTSGICPNIDSVQFNINTEDDPGFSYDTTEYCQGSNNPVPTITGTSGGTFSASAGIVFVSTATGEIDLSASSAGGPYSITYTTPGPLCSNDSTFQITIYAEDDPSFSYSNSWYCQGDTLQLPTIAGTTGGTFSAPPEIDLLDMASGEFDPAGSTAGGPYTITYATPGPECPNSQTFDITIYPEDDPNISYSDTVYCSAESNPVPTIATPGGSFNVPTEIILVNSATGEIDLESSAAGGPYDIIYSTSGANCPNTDTFALSIIEQDQALIDYGDTSFCTSDGLLVPTLNGTTTGTFTTNSDSLAIDTLNGEIDLSISPQNTYQITFITSGQCKDTNTFEFNLYEQPTADAGNDQTLFFNFDTQLNALPANAGTGSWSLLKGSGSLADEYDPQTQVTSLEYGNNNFEWSITNGSCPIAYDEVIITVHELFIPEAITPNNDGKNDVLLIEGIELLDHKIEIFNRWGQKVYETDEYQNNWNGIDNSGKELSADTYFYIIQVKDKTFKGYIVLKR